MHLISCIINTLHLFNFLIQFPHQLQHFTCVSLPLKYKFLPLHTDEFLGYLMALFQLQLFYTVNKIGRLSWIASI